MNIRDRLMLAGLVIVAWFGLIAPVLSETIHQRTLEVCGLPPRDVILVEPSTLPKTSSGKLQRSKCRELYLAETLSVR